MNPTKSPTEIRRSLLQDHGITWLLDRNAARLTIAAAGQDRSGAIILMDIPDDVVIERASAIRARKLIQVREYADQVNALLSSPVLKFCYGDRNPEADLDRTLQAAKNLLEFLETGEKP